MLYSRQSTLQLQAYSDTTWASSPNDRVFVTSYYIFLGSSLIVWKTKKQHIVAKSSVEAEVHVLASTVYEVLWLRSILQDFGVPITSPISIHYDSIRTLQIVADLVKHELSKHISVDAHFTRCHVRS